MDDCGIKEGRAVGWMELSGLGNEGNGSESRTLHAVIVKRCVPLLDWYTMQAYATLPILSSTHRITPVYALPSLQTPSMPLNRINQS